MKKGTQRVMNTQSRSQNGLNRILEKIQEIIEKSADGDYIYRGEPEQYKEKPYDGKVSSNLYREYLEVEAEHFDITVVQKEILDNAREYIGEAVRDFEILTELQHRGGNTNLIDFTTDYLIALFFACDGSQNKPGRVILLKKESERYKVEKASKTINRAESQKSVFVQSDTGFIGPEQYKVVCIPDDLKTYMLDYLQKHHDISTRTIYNDLQGFIENRRIHRSAYTEFYRGLTCQERGDVAETNKEKHDHYESAVKCYTEALKLNPQMFVAYHNRGIVYSDKGEYDASLQDFSTAIENNPDDAKAYYNRGVIYLRKGEYDATLQGFSRAIKLDPDYANAYHSRGTIYSKKGEYDAALQVYCHRKLGPPPKPRLCYNDNLSERSIRWEPNEEDSLLSLKHQLFLRHSAVKVHKRNCVAAITSVKTRSQNGSSSSLKMRPLCLPPRINNPARQPSGSHILNTSLGG